MNALESYLNNAFNANRDLIGNAFTGALYLFLAACVLFIVYLIWSHWWLKRKLIKLTKSGLSRQEARAHIKSLEPLPQEVKFLVWLKHGKQSDYYLSDYLKEFSGKHLGTTPERQT